MPACRFVQVTRVPALTVMVAGTKAKFEMLTLTVGPPVAGGGVARRCVGVGRGVGWVVGSAVGLAIGESADGCADGAAALATSAVVVAAMLATAVPALATALATGAGGCEARGDLLALHAVSRTATSGRSTQHPRDRTGLLPAAQTPWQGTGGDQRRGAGTEEQQEEGQAASGPVSRP
jgi:hypothetical protein